MSLKRLLSTPLSLKCDVIRCLSSKVGKKLVIHEFGDPTSVVKLESDDVKNPGSDEVLIEMLIANVNPADINIIQGTYPIKPTLPGVPGTEGVGKVIKIGENVKNLKVGDIVIPNAENFGTWRTHKIAKQESVLEIPPNVPIVEVAGIMSNASTAYRMLKDFVTLKRGDVIIQNGANSAAGQNVIQLCKAWSFKSVNIVRNRPDIDDLKKFLTNLGADLVLTEEELRTTKMFKNNEYPNPKLALNCIGGKNASEIMRQLAPKGVIVTYGGMSREPVTIPTSLFIFKDITAKGYWMTRWARENRNSYERNQMLYEIMQLMIDNKLKAPAHKLTPLSKYTEALTSATNPKGFTGTKFIIDFRI